MNDTHKDLTIKEALYLFHKDGVVDLIAGATLINFGFDLLNQALTTSLFTWLPIILLSSVKNKNTFPRIDQYLEQFDSKQKRLWTFIPSLIMIFSMIILGTSMLGESNIFFEKFVPSSTGDLRSLVGNFILALICLVPALWVNLKQFYIYSAIAFVVGIASFFFFPGQWSMFINGAVMVAIGVIKMIRFSKEYPLPVEPSVDEN